jgi:hypothetical protein
MSIRIRAPIAEVFEFGPNPTIRSFARRSEVAYPTQGADRMR